MATAPSRAFFAHDPNDRSFRASWVAACFACLVGVAMVYVPYEFGAPVFRYIYPWARPLGTAFLASGVFLGISALYPEWPRALGVAGGVLFSATLGIYWWFANVLTGGITGAVVYPLLLLAVVAELLPSVRRRVPIFPFFIGLAALALGACMLLAPAAFPETHYRYLRPVLIPAGLWFCTAGAFVVYGASRRHTTSLRWSLVLLALPFAALTVSLARVGAWSGAALYLSIVAGGAAYLVWPKVPASRSIRWQLWRGMTVAACVPLLALGGLACVLMQRGIESQALAEVKLAVDTEVQWLSQQLEAERKALLGHASLQSFQTAILERDQKGLELSIQLLQYHAATFESVFVAVPDGTVLARTHPKIPTFDSLKRHAYFNEAVSGSRLVFSEPYIGADDQARVALAIPVMSDGVAVGVLGGTLSLDELTRTVSLTSARYTVQVFDKSSGRLVRETVNHRLHENAWIPPPLKKALHSADSGHYVGNDPSDKQVLVAWAHIPETDWVVVAHQDVASAYALVTRLGMGAVLVVHLAALLALLLSHWVASSVTRRVRQVRQAAEALSHGDLSGRVPPEGNDELANLARSFNQMAEQVESAQTELQRINGDLRAAVDLRDEFLSVASHELRTPLTPLKATAQILRMILTRDAPLDRTRTVSMLNRLDRQTDRLAMLVNDMLDTARIQAGRFVLTPAEMDLCELVQDVTERNRSVNDDIAERLICEIPDQPVVGTWDGPRLEQVVVNLVENALRYSPKGGEIRVAVQDLGESVRVVVSDKGIGIPADNLTQLFERFFRASNAASRHFGGLGLGLHICREIVDRHGGRIWAESEGVDKGSSFFIELPRHAPAQPVVDEHGNEVTDANDAGNRAA